MFRNVAYRPSIYEIETMYLFSQNFFFKFTAPLLWILCLVDDSTDLPANVHFLQIPFLRDPCGDLEKFIQDQINGLKQHVPNKTNKQTNKHHKQNKLTNKKRSISICNSPLFDILHTTIIINYLPNYKKSESLFGKMYIG